MENCKKATPLIAFGLALLLACQQDELPPSVDQVDYEAIGLEHNQGLHSMLQKLNEIRTTNGSIVTSSAIDFLEQEAVNFTLENHPELSSEAAQELKKNISKMKSFLCAYNNAYDRESAAN